MAILEIENNLGQVLLESTIELFQCYAFTDAFFLSLLKSPKLPNCEISKDMKQLILFQNCTVILS